MENLFGKILPEYKTEENLKTIFSEDVFNYLKQEARNYVNEGKQPAHIKDDVSITENIANLVFDGMERIGFFKNLFVYSNTDFQGSFKFDLKLLIILSFYFDQISLDAGFPENTPYVDAFAKNFQFKGKKQSIFDANNNHYPLEQFFLPSGKTEDGKKETMRIHSFIDMALSIALLGTSSSNNIYLKNAFSKTVDINRFLQLFKYCYFDKADISKLLKTELKKIKVSTSKMSVLPDSAFVKRNRKIKQWVDDNRLNISPEGYAILNQYCIERLTNINYIISLFDYKKNDFDLLNYSKFGLLAYWLLVPLFKTRLMILRNLKKYNGRFIPQSDRPTEDIARFFGDSRIILEEIIPIACGMFCYLMKHCKCSIPKDDKYFIGLYRDPNNYKNDSDEGYVLFALNRTGNGKRLVPTEKFLFCKDSILHAVLDKQIKTSSSLIKLKRTDNIFNRIYQLSDLYKAEYDSRITESLRQERCNVYYYIKNIEHKLALAKSERPLPIIKAKNNILGEFTINNNLDKEEIKKLETELSSLKIKFDNLHNEIRESETLFMKSTYKILELFNMRIIPDQNDSIEITTSSSIPVPCYKCSIDDPLFDKNGLLYIEFVSFVKDMAYYFDNKTEESFKSISFLPAKDKINNIFQTISEGNYARIMNSKLIGCLEELERVYYSLIVNEQVSHNQQNIGTMTMHSSNKIYK